MAIDIKNLSKSRKYSITTKDGNKSFIVDPFAKYALGYHIWFLDKVWDRLYPGKITYEELEKDYKVEELPLKKPKNVKI